MVRTMDRTLNRIRPIAGGRPGWDPTQAGQPARPGPTEHPPRAKPRKAYSRRTGRADGHQNTRATRDTRGPAPSRNTRGPAPQARDPQESERARQEYVNALGKIAHKLLSLADLDAVYDVKHSGREVALYMARYGPSGWTLGIRVRKPPPELGWHLPSLDAQLTDLAGGFQVELVASTSYFVGASFSERRLSDGTQLPRASLVACAHLAILLWWIRIAVDELGISFAKLRGPGALDHTVSRAISDFQEALTSADPEACRRAGGPKLAAQARQHARHAPDAEKHRQVPSAEPEPEPERQRPPGEPRQRNEEKQRQKQKQRRRQCAQTNRRVAPPECRMRRLHPRDAQRRRRVPQIAQLRGEQARRLEENISLRAPGQGGKVQRERAGQGSIGRPLRLCQDNKRSKRARGGAVPDVRRPRSHRRTLPVAATAAATAQRELSASLERSRKGRGGV